MVDPGRRFDVPTRCVLGGGTAVNSTGKLTIKGAGGAGSGLNYGVFIGGAQTVAPAGQLVIQAATPGTNAANLTV